MSEANTPQGGAEGVERETPAGGKAPEAAERRNFANPETEGLEPDRDPDEPADQIIRSDAKGG